MYSNEKIIAECLYQDFTSEFKSSPNFRNSRRILPSSIKKEDLFYDNFSYSKYLNPFSPKEMNSNSQIKEKASSLLRSKKNSFIKIKNNTISKFSSNIPRENHNPLIKLEKYENFTENEELNNIETIKNKFVKIHDNLEEIFQISDEINDDNNFNVELFENGLKMK